MLGCWLSGSLLGLFAQLVIGWGSLRQARWRGLPSGQLDIHHSDDDDDDDVLFMQRPRGACFMDRLLENCSHAL